MNIGDIIKDNDPRSGTRILRIVGIEPPHVIARRLIRGLMRGYPKNGYKISASRIHPQGTKRKTGFTLVTSDELE